MLDQLVLRRLGPSSLAAGLATGDVDVGLPEADEAVRTALAGVMPRAAVQRPRSSSVTQLALRADTGPLRDVHVRQALGKLIDRNAVRAAVAPDALPADALGLAPSQPGYAPDRPADGRAGPGRGRAAPHRGGLEARRRDRPLEHRRTAGPRGWSSARAPTAPTTCGWRRPWPPSSAPQAWSRRSSPRPRPICSRSRPWHPPRRARARPHRRRPPPPRRPLRRGGGGRHRGPSGPSAATSAPSWPARTAADRNRAVPRTRRESPTGSASPALQPLFNELMSSAPRADSEAVVERVPLAAVAALPLFQPVQPRREHRRSGRGDLRSAPGRCSRAARRRSPVATGGPLTDHHPLVTIGDPIVSGNPGSSVREADARGRPGGPPDRPMS